MSTENDLSSIIFPILLSLSDSLSATREDGGIKVATMPTSTAILTRAFTTLVETESIGVSGKATSTRS